MYDERQHLDLFALPTLYLFRGTLPSSAFPTPYRGCGVTPTSVDPIVATLFACRYRMAGPAIVLLALKQDLADRLDGPNLMSFAYELAVNIDLHPDEFEKRCVLSVSVDQSLALLAELGYRLPTRLPDFGALTQAIEESSRMQRDEIDRYAARCFELTAGG